ncbi:MAG: hypothetical protein WD063_08435 [Pirellulales bacterium]
MNPTVAGFAVASGVLVVALAILIGASDISPFVASTSSRDVSDNRAPPRRPQRETNATPQSSGLQVGGAMRNSADAMRTSAAMQERKIDPPEALKQMADVTERQAKLLDDLLQLLSRVPAEAPAPQTTAPEPVLDFEGQPIKNPKLAAATKRHHEEYRRGGELSAEIRHLMQGNEQWTQELREGTRSDTPQEAEQILVQLRDIRARLDRGEITIFVAAEARGLQGSRRTPRTFTDEAIASSDFIARIEFRRLSPKISCNCFGRLV